VKLYFDSKEKNSSLPGDLTQVSTTFIIVTLLIAVAGDTQSEVAKFFTLASQTRTGINHDPLMTYQKLINVVNASGNPHPPPPYPSV
jgi:hypothetical protein